MKNIALISSILLLLVMIWANYKRPSLSERYQTEPAKLVLFTTKNILSNIDKDVLKQEFVKIKGVKSVSIQSQNIAILYEKEADEFDWEKLLNKYHIRVQQSALNHYQGAKCPIPDTYIHSFTKVKMLFCFR